MPEGAINKHTGTLAQGVTVGVFVGVAVCVTVSVTVSVMVKVHDSVASASAVCVSSGEAKAFPIPRMSKKLKNSNIFFIYLTSVGISSFFSGTTTAGFIKAVKISAILGNCVPPVITMARY